MVMPRPCSEFLFSANAPSVKYQHMILFALLSNRCWVQVPQSKARPPPLGRITTGLEVVRCSTKVPALPGGPRQELPLSKRQFTPSLAGIFASNVTQRQSAT